VQTQAVARVEKTRIPGWRTDDEIAAPWRSRDGRFHLSEHAGGLLDERAVRHPRVDEHSGEQ
jgi:archaeosine-15-forming tRNA-guanine transglycosylase